MPGGEAVLPRLYTLLGQAAPSSELCNIYGPTECTVWCTNLFTHRYKCGNEQPTIPIGNPGANQPCYVLDPFMRPCPIGVPGELFIGGAGVARGYAKRPELTSERFLPDPFSKDQYKRMYRTGDLVRWLPDGNLMYMGRLDQQVKLRGFRIELGEVEARICQLEGVLEAGAQVMCHPISGLEQLVAFVASSRPLTSHDVLKSLAQSLPQHMVPHVLTVLPILPHLPNGKVDRKSLPDPDWSSSASASEFIAPATELEERLHALWLDVLHVPASSLGTTVNFFALGGNSLAAMRLVARIRSMFPTLPHLDIVHVFQHPTVQKLALLLESLQMSVLSEAEWQADVEGKDEEEEEGGGDEVGVGDQRGALRMRSSVRRLTTMISNGGGGSSSGRVKGVGLAGSFMLLHLPPGDPHQAQPVSYQQEQMLILFHGDANKAKYNSSFAVPVRRRGVAGGGVGSACNVTLSESDNCSSN